MQASGWADLFQFFLASLGLLISIYFTGVYFKWFSADARWIPTFCRLGEKTCASVLDTPRAKLFGLPNSLFGIGVYSYLIVDVFWFSPRLGFFLTAASLLRSVYLAYSLLFITRIPCVLCFTSHGVNLLLFFLYLGKVLS